jgi:hypothetical protein
MRLSMATGRIVLGALCALSAPFGCGGDSAHALHTGVFSKTIFAVDSDACGIAHVGAVDTNYGRLTVTDTQVTHTDQQTFTNEIYMRSSNTLTRGPAMVDMPEPGMGMCLITATITENGQITADDVIEITHHEAHAIKSGDCTGILNTNCQSTFQFRLFRTGM